MTDAEMITARAQLGLAVPVCLAPAHVQSAAEALAAPHQRADPGSVGRKRPIVTPDYGRHYAGLIPGAAFETIPNAGHHPELEQPATFIQRVENFLP